MIYLDHSATTPLAPEARAAMAEAMDALASGLWANPSSVHTPGRRARGFLNTARARVAAALGARAGEIVFTGSASEANNLALKGFALGARPGPVLLAVSAIEHECVLETARYLAARFDHVRLVEIPPDGEGVIHPGALERALDEAGAGEPLGGGKVGVAGVSVAGIAPAATAILVAVIMVHNETGVRQPIEALAGVARRRGAVTHVDAAQAFGREAIDAAALGADTLSVSGHKIGGPRGVGALVVRQGVKLDSLIHGGMQEGSRRAGTEALELIAGFAAAAELAASGAEAARARAAALEREFLAELARGGTEFHINGAEARRVPGILNLSLPGARSHDLVIGMDLAGCAISAGSACSSGVIEASRSLLAMGLDAARVEAAIRVSFGRGNTPEDARAAGAALGAVAARLRGENIS